MSSLSDGESLARLRIRYGEERLAHGLTTVLVETAGLLELETTGSGLGSVGALAFSVTSVPAGWIGSAVVGLIGRSRVAGLEGLGLDFAFKYF
jgi:hypothetical protein